MGNTNKSRHLSSDIPTSAYMNYVINKNKQLWEKEYKMNLIPKNPVSVSVTDIPKQDCFLKFLSMCPCMDNELPFYYEVTLTKIFYDQ